MDTYDKWIIMDAIELNTKIADLQIYLWKKKMLNSRKNTIINIIYVS